MVEIYRYVQQRTFDAYSWQTLTTKAVFFDQMRRGKIIGREMNALGETALSYGQIKVLITRYAEIHPAEPAMGQEHPAVQQVRRHLDEHFAQGVSLAELARLVGFSPYYLHRVFEREMGLPPHAYLESVRIRQAQRLLAQGHSIVQVSSELGFSDQSHLTRRFTRLLGITPGHYLHSKIVQDTQAAHRVQ